jgi:hypothetical protein
MDQFDKAVAKYRLVSSEVSTREGAESKYNIAKIFYDRNDDEAAQDEIFEMIEMNTPQQYWMARSFLLLGEILIRQDDLFQAKYTIQSLIDGYTETNDGILDEASRLMERIENLEEQSGVPSDEPTEENRA